MTSRESAASEITPEVLLRAYACGIFPMAESADDPTLFWVEPEMRGVIPLQGFRIASRLARTVRSDTFSVTVDTAFKAVIAGCAAPQPGRDDTWINKRIRDLYVGLYELGHCHSVEVWQDGDLVGGLYGVSLGRAFFGESMFHRARDASKVALVHLVARLIAGGFELLDTQYVTEHLRSFGAVEISRRRYRALLDKAIAGEPADFMRLPAQHQRRGSARDYCEARLSCVSRTRCAAIAGQRCAAEPGPILYHSPAIRVPVLLRITSCCTAPGTRASSGWRLNSRTIRQTVHPAAAAAGAAVEPVAAAALELRLRRLSRRARRRLLRLRRTLCGRRRRRRLRRIGLRADDGLVGAFAVGQPDVVDRMLDAMQAGACRVHPAREDPLHLALQRDLVDLDKGVGVGGFRRRPRVAGTGLHAQRAELHGLADILVEIDDAAGDLVEAGEARLLVGDLGGRRLGHDLVARLQGRRRLRHALGWRSGAGAGGALATPGWPGCGG